MSPNLNPKTRFSFLTLIKGKDEARNIENAKTRGITTIAINRRTMSLFLKLVYGFSSVPTLSLTVWKANSTEISIAWCALTMSLVFCNNYRRRMTSLTCTTWWISSSKWYHQRAHSTTFNKKYHMLFDGSSNIYCIILFDVTTSSVWRHGKVY